MTEREVKHGRGWVFVEDVPISDELTKKLKETSTHYYRDVKGNIINYIRCVQEKEAIA